MREGSCLPKDLRVGKHQHAQMPIKKTNMFNPNADQPDEEERRIGKSSSSRISIREKTKANRSRTGPKINRQYLALSVISDT